MFKETKEGTTHSYNDGCGEPAHNNQTSLREEFLQRFFEVTFLDSHPYDNSFKDTEKIDFLFSRFSKLLEGLRVEEKTPKNELHEYVADIYNSLARSQNAKLDEIKKLLK